MAGVSEPAKAATPATVLVLAQNRLLRETLTRVLNKKGDIAVLAMATLIVRFVVPAPRLGLITVKNWLRSSATTSAGAQAGSVTHLWTAEPKMSGCTFDILAGVAIESNIFG